MKVRWGVLALTGAVLAGCGSGSGAGSEGSSLPGYAREPGVPRVKSAADFPELPLDRYEFSGREEKRLREAKNRLQRECMRSFGFEDFPLEPDTWIRGTRMANSFTSTLVYVSPYGTLDLDRARRWGYGSDPGRTESMTAELLPKGREVTDREDPVLNGTEAGEGGRSVVHGRRVPAGGCSAEATRRTMATVGDETRLWAYVPERTEQIDTAVAKDERVRRAFADWSRCVEDKGFKRYASPARAFRDEAWRRGREDGSTHRTKRELGTAVADVECNRDLNVAGVWWAVADEKQRDDLRRNKSRYEAVRTDQNRVRAEVRKVLG
ncbi:hypothetical protein ABZV77_15960 [Streptomyces sp. NPDC004732]|uniref:hypothetical protein n=1 Tax=Streptomyces sp. NPDC004732 TaxID=3154290 RepID=UPI0033A714B3